MFGRAFGFGAAAVRLCRGRGGSETVLRDLSDGFDTGTTIVGRDTSEEALSRKAQKIHDELLVYHQLFDIYNEYEGNNLKTVNDNAGIGPVEVDRAIIDLLLDCRAYYDLTGGKVNVAMGSVLRLWHIARNDSIDDPANAYLPAEEALAEAAKHTSWDTILIDAEACTVYVTDPEQLLDVGAIAKGWATQRVARELPAGLLISVGGNVVATGPKEESGTPWVVGITDPNGESPAFEAFGYKQLIFEPFFGGGLVTALAVPIIYLSGPWPLFGVMLVVFLIAVLSGLLLFRPREMKERKEWEDAGRPEDEDGTGGQGTDAAATV